MKSQIADVTFADEFDQDKYQEFLDQMSDDLNTPNAYMVIFDTVKLLNQALRTRDIDWKQVEREYNAVRKMMEILGVFIERKVLSEEDRDTYRKWNEAKAVKDFETADRYRNILMEKGIL